MGESKRWGDGLGRLRGHTEGLKGQAEEFVLYTTGDGSLLSGEYKALPLRELYQPKEPQQGRDGCRIENLQRPEHCWNWHVSPGLWPGFGPD